MTAFLIGIWFGGILGVLLRQEDPITTMLVVWVLTMAIAFFWML